MDPQSLSSLVVAGGFAIGIGFGAVVQLTRFCTMGAIADLVNFGDATRLRMWVWAALVALLGTQALIVSGTVDLSSSIYAGRRIAWAALLLGGAAFGFGMVLSSGCPSRALVRLGTGNLKGLVVLLAVAIGAQMALRGVFAPVRVEALEPWAWVLAGSQELPSTLARSFGSPSPAAEEHGAGAIAWRLGACALLSLALLPWLLRSREFRRRAPVLGGLAVGALVSAAWWTTGALGFLAEHPDTLEPAWLATDSRRPEALSFVAPSAYALDLLTLWTDRSRHLSFGIAVWLGTLTGAALAALARRQWRWEGFRSTADLAQHLIGGLLMGLGGVTALGCSIGQGVSGLSLLSIGSAVAVAGIVAGTVAALRWQAWRIDRDG